MDSVKTEAERRYPPKNGLVWLNEQEAFNAGVQFANDEARNYYMAEFQDLHDTHGCQYLDMLRELQSQVKITADRLSEIEDERTTFEHRVKVIEEALREIIRYATQCYDLNFAINKVYLVEIADSVLSIAPNE